MKKKDSFIAFLKVSFHRVTIYIIDVTKLYKQ